MHYDQFFSRCLQIWPTRAFVLRRKMLKSQIARLPGILLDFINRPSGETDCIYEVNFK